jgi:hypothetical protein
MNIDKTSIDRPNWATWSGTVGTTPAQLPSWPVVKSVILRADSANSGTISIGPSAGCANFVVGPGETSPPLFVSDASCVWYVGSAADQVWSSIAI